MAKKIDNRHRIIGGRHRALSRYYMILNRIRNTHRRRNSKYAGVEMRIPKDEFCAWFMANDFAGASVDRIDSSGHYEFGNVRLIPTSLNIILGKLKATGGVAQCFRCKAHKPMEDFVRDSRRIATGRTTICKPCERERKASSYSTHPPPP